MMNEIPLNFYDFKIIVLMYMTKTTHDVVSNWKFKRPREYYIKCVELFGEPTFVANVRQGHALWKTKGLFTQQLLVDEDVKHCVPRPHHDYFYSSVRFYVPKDKFSDVLKISGSLMYDGLKKELTARCGGIGANYATLYLAMLVASNQINIKDVKSKDMYPRMIQGKIIPHKEMAKKMMVLKKENNVQYKKELKNPFATYAFEKCNSPTKSASGNVKFRVEQSLPTTTPKGVYDTKKN